MRSEQLRLASMLPLAGPRLLGTGRTRRVLIADDERDWADLLAGVLLDDGYDVRVAYDGAQAVAQVLEFRPHVALLDVRMPALTGFEVARRCRRQALDPRPVLVAVTAWPGRSGRARALEVGFDDYVDKALGVVGILRLMDRLEARAG